MLGSKSSLSIRALLRQSVGGVGVVALFLVMAAIGQGVAPIRALNPSLASTDALLELRDSPKWYATGHKLLDLLYSPELKELADSLDVQAASLETLDVPVTETPSQRAVRMLEFSKAPLASVDPNWERLVENINAITQTEDWRHVVDALSTVMRDPAVAAEIDRRYLAEHGPLTTGVQRIDFDAWGFAGDALTWLAEGVIIVTAAVACGVTVVCVIGAAAGALYLGLRANDIIEKYASEGRRGSTIRTIVCHAAYCEVDGMLTSKNRFPSVVHTHWHFYLPPPPQPGGGNLIYARGSFTLLGNASDQNVWSFYARLDEPPDTNWCQYTRLDLEVHVDWNDGGMTRAEYDGAHRCA
jgi:hypothetical protein